MNKSDLNNEIEEDYCSDAVTDMLITAGFDVDIPNPQPTHALAIEWIRINFELYVSPGFNRRSHRYSCTVYDVKVEEECMRFSAENYSEPWGATEEALIYTLGNLI